MKSNRESNREFFNKERRKGKLPVKRGDMVLLYYSKLVVTELLARYNIRNIPIAAYHPQSNGLVERGHQRIIDSVLN